ncbi:type II secretion system GspH family protein [Akkermansiaceae bacterium]|nr:type II secretion system GspH family protein [Akkermansiaceae bacterium]MDB4537995.1 type II secretion system GspH family protein [Akkermansiaceae bacterium]
MKLTKKQMRKGFTLVELLVVIAIIAVLAGLATPAILKAKKSADKAKTINNAKQIGIAMTEFDSQYGEFPSDETRQLLEDEGSEVPIGNTANDYLAQLLISKILDSEKVFYAKGVRGVREGDDVFNTRDKALEKSENGFGYIMLNDGTALSQSYGSSAIPVICAPLKSGGIDPVFDAGAYNNEYVYLKLDSSVGTGKVNEAGKALLKGQGKTTIMTTGEDTIWGSTDQPIVRPPAAIQ